MQATFDRIDILNKDALLVNRELVLYSIWYVIPIDDKGSDSESTNPCLSYYNNMKSKWNM